MLKLRGITWDHPRGRVPLLATAAAFQRDHPNVQITWEARSLHEFGHQGIDALARDYDLIVIDHPWVGFIAATGCCLAFDALLPSGTLDELRSKSAGPSHGSYQWDGKQWALAIDAATPCASYRPDLLDKVGAQVPQCWSEVLELGKACGERASTIALPLGPVDAITAFLSLAVNIGAAPFADAGQVVDDETGTAVLDALQAVVPYCCRDVFELTPISMMDRMATTDQLVYCPLAYGYSNYSRPGFRPHLCVYAEMPGVRGADPRGSHLGGTGIAISARCRHVETAVAYAKKTAAAAWQRSIYFDAGGQPAHSQAWDDPGINAKCSNFFGNTRRTIEGAYVRPRYNGYIQFQYAGGAALTRFLSREGGTTQETLAELNRMYTASLGN